MLGRNNDMKISIARYSVPYILVFLILSIVFYALFWPIGIVFSAFLLFTIFFFRDPERTIPQEPNIILSPADGKVMSVEEIEEDKFLKSRARKVSIFLSLFDVHINRVPFSGTVKYKKYIKGKFVPAYKKEAPLINERNEVGIDCGNIKILVTQIAGIVARRIICNINNNEKVSLGDRFGMIKFGSCTEIVFPANVELKVKVGDKVKGAETIIGVVK